MRTRLITIILVTLLMPIILPTSYAQEGPKPEAVGLRPDAPPYALHGPYWVGYQSIMIGEGTAHQLDAHLWYPALNLEGNTEEITYTSTFKFTAGTLPEGLPPEIYGHALLNAVPDVSNGPYPLLVWSPGFGVSGPWESPQLEHYASWGFVVLVPEHIEQWDWESSDYWRTVVDRPRDIIQVLDYAEDLTTKDGGMAGMIDTGQVAVGGHSAGGYTALAAAGAQFDMADFQADCASLSEAEYAISDCPAFIGHEEEMAARAGLDPMPQGLWPSWGDSRVDAIIPMASGARVFGETGMAKIMVPMLLLSGTFDASYAFNDTYAYNHTSSAQKALVGMIGADHPINFPPCEDVPWAVQTPFYTWLCLDPVWDKDRALDLINHLTTAFLLATLKGDADAADALAPDAVQFPGIEYQAQGF